jgi:hypothetical protein
MPRLIDAWEFGGEEGLPSIARYVVSQQILEFDRKNRRRELNMAIRSPHKGKVAPPPNAVEEFRENQKVWFFGNRSGFVDQIDGDKIWIKDGTVPFWVHRAKVSAAPPKVFPSKMRH